MLHFSHALILTLMSFNLVANQALGQKNVTMDEITKAWSAKQKKVTSLQLSWTEKYFMTKGSQLGKDFGGMKECPAKDTEVKREVSLKLGKDRWRLETEGPIWWSMTEELIDVQDVDIFNGRIYIDFLGWKKKNKDAYKTAHLYRHYEHATDDPRIWAPFKVVRPLHPTIGKLKKGEWKIEPKRQVVGKTECVIIARKPNVNPRSKAFERVFLDPNRDYAILRRVLAWETYPMVEIDIEHAKDPKAGWIPSSWKVTIHETGDPDQISTVYEAKVTKYSVNDRVKDSWFKFEFPPGTQIHDSTVKK